MQPSSPYSPANTPVSRSVSPSASPDSVWSTYQVQLAFLGVVVFAFAYPFLDELVGDHSRRAARVLKGRLGPEHGTRGSFEALS